MAILCDITELFVALPLQRKKFEIRAVDQPDKLTLYSGCDDKSKLLLGLCRDTHQFTMAIAPRVNEAKRREEEGQFDFVGSCIFFHSFYQS